MVDLLARKPKAHYCTMCSFGKLPMRNKPKYSLQQIVEGAYIDLCSFHAHIYLTSRLFGRKYGDNGGTLLDRIREWFKRRREMIGIA